MGAQRPDSRLQRTGSSPSALPSPLTRRPPGAPLVVPGLLIVGLVVSCRTTTPTRPRASPASEGRVSYEAVIAPDSNPSSLIPQVDYIPANPAPENRSPTYPECLVALGLPPQAVVVRILVDEQGQVTGVQPSAVPSDVEEAYRADFVAAITEAVLAWQFTPAMRRTYVDSTDLDSNGRPLYKVLKGVRPAPTDFDIRFVFEIRLGKAVVTKQ